MLGLGAAHRFGDGVRTLFEFGHASADHIAFERLCFARSALRLAELSLAEQAPQITGERLDVHAMRGEVPQALEHDGEADHAQTNQEPEDPLSSEQGKREKAAGDVHVSGMPPQSLECRTDFSDW